MATTISVSPLLLRTSERGEDNVFTLPDKSRNQVSLVSPSCLNKIRNCCFSPVIFNATKIDFVAKNQSITLFGTKIGEMFTTFRPVVFILLV
jgi:hypothetical protein